MVFCSFAKAVKFLAKKQMDRTIDKWRLTASVDDRRIGNESKAIIPVSLRDSFSSEKYQILPHAGDERSLEEICRKIREAKLKGQDETAQRPKKYVSSFLLGLRVKC